MGEEEKEKERKEEYVAEGAEAVPALPRVVLDGLGLGVDGIVLLRLGEQHLTLLGDEGNLNPKGEDEEKERRKRRKKRGTRSGSAPGC